jgi:hypothetical protein
MSPTVGVGAVAGAGDVEDAIVVVDGGGGGVGSTPFSSSLSKSLILKV